MQGSPQIRVDPAAADPTNAAVMKEYRFSDLASCTYTRDDGRTLKIRAARFEIFLQLRRVKRVVVLTIQLESNLAARLEMPLGQVI